MGRIKDDGVERYWVDNSGEEHELLVTCACCGTHIDVNNEPVPDQTPDLSHEYLGELVGLLRYAASYHGVHPGEVYRALGYVEL